MTNNPFHPKPAFSANSSNTINTRSNQTGNNPGFPSSNIGNNPSMSNRFSNQTATSSVSNNQPPVTNYFMPASSSNTGRFTPNNISNNTANSFNTASTFSSNNSLGANAFNKPNAIQPNNSNSIINSNPFLQGGGNDNSSQRMGFSHTNTSSNTANTAHMNRSLPTNSYAYSSNTYNPIMKKPEMDTWSVPPLTVPNGYDLNSTKMKLPPSVKPNLDDISKAVFYRIPMLKDDETRSTVKSHVITQLPEYMPFSIEELRYLNKIKNKNQNFELTYPTYCESTKNSKIGICKNLADAYTYTSFENIEKNKYQEWFTRFGNTNQDNTFKGMVNQPGFVGGSSSISGKFNGYGLNTSGNTQNSGLPFFKPENSLNTMNNNNQFTNMQNSSNFPNNFGNQVNPSVSKYNIQPNSTPTSFSTGHNLTNNFTNNNFNNQIGNRDQDLFNENTNTVNNNLTDRYGFNQPGLNNNNSNNNNIQQFNNLNTNNTNFPMSNSQNNNYNNFSSQTTGIKPSGNFNFNTNNNPQNQFNSQSMNNNQYQFNNNNPNTNYLSQNNNNTWGTGNFDYSNNRYNVPNQTNFSNQSQNGNNFNNNYYVENNCQLQQKDINKILNNSIQNFTHYDDVITFLNDGKKENIYSKLASNYLNSQFEDKPEYKVKRKSDVIDFNQYKRIDFFIPSDITNPQDIKLLKNFYAGRKTEPINTRRTNENKLKTSQQINNTKSVIPPFKETYNNFLSKNGERTIFKGKLDNIKTNQKIIENNRNNQFLIPALRPLPTNHDNKNNIKKKEEAVVTNDKVEKSGLFYKVVTEFDNPNNLSHIYKTDNRFSIGNYKARLIDFLHGLPEFSITEIKSSNIGFIIGGGMENRDAGGYDLDKLAYEQTDNTPASNMSSSQFVDRNEIQNFKVIKIRAMLTNPIIRIYNDNRAKLGKNKDSEGKNNFSNSQHQKPKFEENKNFLPILTKDYVLDPKMEILQKMTKSQLQIIKNFSITNHTDGRIVFSQPVDITYTNLDAIIINHKHFELDASERTTFNKLNKEALVVFFNCKNNKNEKSEEEYTQSLNEMKEICRKLKVTLYH